MDLRARTAGTCLPHLPEVILLIEAKDMRLGKEVLPQGIRLIVRTIHRGIQALLVQSPDLREQLPAPGYGLLLVIIAEAPVAEHLEEGMVIGVISHFLQIVVLTAHADALLRIHRAHEVT